MFELIDEEHECFDYTDGDDIPMYVLSGNVYGIDDSRIGSMITHLQEAIQHHWKGMISVTSNFKVATGYDYITEIESELDHATEIQSEIDSAINQFRSLH